MALPRLTVKFLQIIHWLSAALKESIKIKYKFFVKSKSCDRDKMPFYQKCRNKQNQLIRYAERKNFNGLLLERKLNLQKSFGKQLKQ